MGKEDNHDITLLVIASIIILIGFVVIIDFAISGNLILKLFGAD